MSAARDPAVPLRSSRTPFWAPLAVGGVLTVIGPFDTFSGLTFWERLVYWNVAVLLTWAQVEGGIVLLLRLLAPPRWPVVVPVGLACLAASALTTAEVAVLENLFRPNGNPSAFLPLYGFVLVLVTAITAPVAFTRLRRERVAETPAAPATPAAAPFLRRVPPVLGRDLLCLEMEDHYVRVHTPSGSDLVLIRMKDAEAELAGIDGLRVHRSWWVARRAVTRAVRTDGRLTLELVNGLRVPVSRTYQAAVQAAGWTT